MAQDEITLPPRGPTPPPQMAGSLPVPSPLPQQPQGPSTLERLLPLIQFASLAALQGPAAAGGFGQGFTQTAQRGQQLGIAERQAQALNAFREQQGENDQRMIRLRERQRADMLVQNSLERAKEFETREEAIGFLRTQDRILSSQGLIRPGSLLASPLPRGFFSAKERARHQQTLTNIEELIGREEMNRQMELPADQQIPVPVDGQRVPFEQFVAQFAGGIHDADGNVIPFDVEGKSDFERMLRIEEDAFRSEHGRSPTPRERSTLARSIDGADSVRQQTDLLRAEMDLLRFRMLQNQVDSIGKSTAGEKQVAAFGLRALESHRAAMTFESRLQDEGFLSRFRSLSMNAPDFFKTELGRSLEPTVREFAAAVLRKESGAAITAEERDDIFQTYFPGPRDTNAQIRSKQTARVRILSGLAFSAGPAWKEMFGHDFNPDDLLPEDASDDASAASALELVGLR